MHSSNGCIMSTAVDHNQFSHIFGKSLSDIKVVVSDM